MEVLSHDAERSEPDRVRGDLRRSVGSPLVGADRPVVVGTAVRMVVAARTVGTLGSLGPAQIDLDSKGAL